MDIGFFTTAGADNTWSLQECATWARSHDFDCVRLSDKGAADSASIIQDPAVLRQGLSDHGLYLACLTAHCNLLDDDEATRLQEQQRLLRAIDAAAAIGCPVVLTGSGSPVKNGQFYGMFSSPPGNGSDRSDELVERYRQMFTPIADHAKDRDIRIALDVAVRMGNIGCNPEMWDRLLDAVPSDHIGLSCDPSHWVWMMILPVEDVIREFAGKWYFADLKDCEVSPRMLYRQGIIGNWWWQYRVCGRGDLNWAKIIHALGESGYDYVLDVENEDRGMPGLEGFAFAGRHLRQLLPDRQQVQPAKEPWRIR
ncbi:MAG: sugar phosphate isomerase/epimerase [Gemmatimonadetes bacterium]|nr:sugar phosphate isomerase/epimerase [Gemmatimonadota bacterium]MBT4613430.1 sugar phosphate isomerase/epimerase [Gemmatimonadota bacterium]MBT5056361.1 sugar phosphate isomerase/epimerase [Gemmatimonadota bacterium]MBT5145131.1 sugar phosphate isomerase/epimerase [Gemmatimonadota bacterium]MBT5586945.1 sugar phosphate isomerase/epimerase [Gemmatimonadota bacterium]